MYLEVGVVYIKMILFERWKEYSTSSQRPMSKI